MADSHESHMHTIKANQTYSKEYLKLLLVLSTILLVSYSIVLIADSQLVQLPTYFMALFFFTFAFFKILDIKGFVASFSGYDIIAKKIPTYGYIYPFIELVLGIGVLIDILFIHWLVLAVMSIGSVGIIQALLENKKIKCACLGTFIKIPLSTISLVEDLAMAGMAIIMIIS